MVASRSIGYIASLKGTAVCEMEKRCFREVGQQKRNRM